MKEQIVSAIFAPQWALYIITALAVAAILFTFADILLIALSRFLRMPLDRGQWLRERLLVICTVLFLGVGGAFYLKDRYNASLKADRILAIAGLPADRISLRFTASGAVILAEKATAVVKGRTLTFERGPVTIDVAAFPKAWSLAGGVTPSRRAE